MNVRGNFSWIKGEVGVLYLVSCPGFTSLHTCCMSGYSHAIDSTNFVHSLYQFLWSNE
jgi:hypothetical protein